MIDIEKMIDVVREIKSARMVDPGIVRLTMNAQTCKRFGSSDNSLSVQEAKFYGIPIHTSVFLADYFCCCDFSDGTREIRDLRKEGILPEFPADPS